MAQTTTAVSQSNFEVQFSDDGTSWTDVSGVATSVSVSGHEQQIGSINTATGDGPIVTASQKYSAADITVSMVYTKTSEEGFDMAMDQWESTDKVIYVRYAPEGGIGTVVGNDVFTLSNAAGSAFAAPIVSILPPALDAGTGEPAMVSLTVRAPKVTRGTTTT